MDDINVRNNNMNNIRLMEKIFLIKTSATAAITMLERIDNVKLEWYSEDKDLYPNILRLELLSEYTQARLKEVAELWTVVTTATQLPPAQAKNKVFPPAQEVRCFIELHIHIRRATNLTEELNAVLARLHEGSTELPEGHEKLGQRLEDVGGEIAKMWKISRELSHIADHESRYETWFRELNGDD